MVASAFVPLDPCALRPDRLRALFNLAPATFWREHTLLPLRLDRQGLLVASGSDLEPRVLRLLRSASAQPVEVVLGAPDEIGLWLDVLEGRRSWAEAMADGLARLLHQLGMESPGTWKLADADQDTFGVEQVMDLFGLREDIAVEALALRARLPWLRLGRYHLAPYLAELLPRHAAERFRVVPLMARGGTALLASPGVLSPTLLDSLRELIGLEPRLAVCAPSEFGAAFASVFVTPPAAGLEPPTDAAVLQHLAHLGALDAPGRDALRRLSEVTREPPVAAGLRLGYFDRWAIQRAWASVHQLDALPPGEQRVDADLAALGAPAVWRRLRCVPIRHAGRAAVVACEVRLASLQADLVRHLLGASELKLCQVLPDQLERLLQRLPDPRPVALTAEDHLLESGRVSPSQAARARRYAERHGLGLAEALRLTGAVDAEDLVEARSVARGRPWIRLAHVAPEAEAARRLPEQLARAELAVALRRQGASLTLALLNGRDEPTPGVVERATGLVVDPILAVVDDPEVAFTRWYAPRPPVPEAYERFGHDLARRGRLSRAALEAAWERLGERSLDEVLTERGQLTPEALRDSFAEYLDIPVAQLEPAERRIQVIDALGIPRVETVWDDPVDRSLARAHPQLASLTGRHAFLPIRRSPGGVEVAFANPLDAAAIQAAQRAWPNEVIQLRVATRRAIDVAQRRVFASRSLGERLLQTGIITAEQLSRALQVHDQAGVRLGQALVNLGFVAEAELAATLADQAGLPFVDLTGVQPDVALAHQLPRELEREQGVLPLYDDGQAVVLGCTDLPQALALDDLAAQLGRPVQPVVVTESALNEALDRLYRDDDLDQSASSLMRRSPADSAKWVLSRGQKLVLGGLLAAFGLGLALAPVATVTLFVSVATVFYVTFSAYKFYLAYRAVTHTLEVETTADEVAALDDRDLPVYTILVPMYRETEVFPILARAIDRLDYPKAKLDVKILLEEDDAETIKAARAHRLPSHFKLVIVPNGSPKGKPKACNYGLIHAQGEYVVIFDAEDIPEPDQLKKALVAFRKCGDRLACVQAKLNYFNRDQNLLTRWFTTEYSMWFDLFLPGLDASGAPIPLGGTSNHFRTDRLRELGAWDPHNVTEDADLGMRLYKAGWKTAVIDSTTYEEANSEVYNWIRQRSRWVKGYIQTYLVHMRHPVRLWRAVGPRAFLSFQLVIGGTFFGFLINPVFWMLTTVWFTMHWGLIKDIFPGWIFYLGAVELYVGNFVFTFLNVAGCLRRGYYSMVKYALLSPIYWALMSVAAWKGFVQLFYAPSYWEKTKHGLTAPRGAG